MRTIDYKSFSKYFLFLLVATCLAPGLLSAQDYRGTFTLPFETRWGPATLPAGNYTFTINAGKAPYLARIRGENGEAIVMAAEMSDRQTVGRSELVLVRRGRQGTVRALTLAIPAIGSPEGGVVFVYARPKGEQPLLAQGPELIQRIPIVAAGK
ncbi:MAG: hypothetical protein ACE145_20365 [Terriglobia bacterium]